MSSVSSTGVFTPYVDHTLPNDEVLDAPSADVAEPAEVPGTPSPAEPVDAKKTAVKAEIVANLSIENMTNNITKFYTVGKKDVITSNAEGQTTLDGKFNALTKLFTPRKGAGATFTNILSRLANLFKHFVPFAALSVQAQTRKELVHTDLATQIVTNFTAKKLEGKPFRNRVESLNKQIADVYVKSLVNLTTLDVNGKDYDAKKTKIENKFTQEIENIAKKALAALEKADTNAINKAKRAEEKKEKADKKEKEAADKKAVKA